MLKLAKIQIPLQKWQHLLILLQPQRVTLPFQRKFCYPPTPGSHQICLSLWYTFWKKGLLRTCKVLATQTIFVYNRGTFFHYISAGGMGTFQVFYNLHLTLHPSSIALSNVSFYVPILGSKKGTCLSDRPALRGFQKGKLTYSFERISCSGHLKSESAVVRVHWCDPGLRGWSVGWSPQNHPGWL